MSDLEIYDSSESQLSSDEYSQDGDDETLMNVAVSKQRDSLEKTPPSSTSINSSPAKSTSAGTSANVAPVEKAHDGNAPPKSVPPPTNREQTERQNKCLQRQSKAYLHYRRRSLRWLKQKSSTGYLEDLKAAVVAVRHRAARDAQYRQARREIEMELEERQRNRERTPSRSPDLICLDDTENEESPEKPNEVTASVKLSSRKEPVETVEVQKQQEEEDAYEHLSEDKLTIENGSELEEFLNLKHNVEKPIVQIQTVDKSMEIVSVASVIELEKNLELVNSKKILDALNDVCKAKANQSTTPLPKAQPCQTVDIPLKEESATLKRRRSMSSPSGVEAIEIIDKRIKTMPAKEINNIIEIIPNETSIAQPAAKPPGVAVAQTIEKISTIPISMPLNVEASNVPTLKLGPAFSYYAEPQLVQQSEELPVMCYTLEDEPMEINFTNEQPLPATTNHYNEKNSAEKPAVATFSATMPHPTAQPPAAVANFIAPMPPPSSVAYQNQKPHVEHVSRQTQTAQVPAEERTPRVTNKSSTATSADLNNSDALFHSRIKELYTELDDIMTDKVQSIKPELKSYGDEKVRIEADIKTLDNLIKQKEEEYNRLLHLRYIKEELHARVERKERILIMKEILPSIFNKNCSTSELYEMHSLLVSEQNAPRPTRYNKSVMEQFINKIERNQEDIKTWRSALGLKEPQRPPMPAAAPYENNLSHNPHRRSSMPAMREASMSMPPPPPPPSVDARASAYGRQGAVLDVRSLIEDYRREHPEELPLVGKRSKQQTMPSRCQFMMNSTPNLAASCSNLQNARRSHGSSLDNNLDNDTIHPLYNSSPLAADSQQRRNHHSNSRAHAYNDVEQLYSGHNTDLTHARRLIQKLERKANSMSNCNERLNKSLLRTATNGPDESMERRCQQCERQEASYMCSGCKNQWYCSRECQLRAWDSHWEACV